MDVLTVMHDEHSMKERCGCVRLRVLVFACGGGERVRVCVRVQECRCVLCSNVGRGCASVCVCVCAGVQVCVV